MAVTGRARANDACAYSAGSGCPARKGYDRFQIIREPPLESHWPRQTRPQAVDTAWQHAMALEPRANRGNYPLRRGGTRRCHVRLRIAATLIGAPSAPLR